MKIMKQVITLLIATIITLSSFASLKPVKFISKSISGASKNRSSLKITLKKAGKVTISWNAGVESTTTSYTIEKSTNGGEFKTVAVLMGEHNALYHFPDNIKNITDDVNYRIVTKDKDFVINELAQNLIVL